MSALESEGPSTPPEVPNTIETHSEDTLSKDGTTEDVLDEVSKDVVENKTSFDQLFADRYTLTNESYAKIANGFDPVVVIHPWTNKPKRVFDYSNNRGGGGWRGRGDWNRNNRGGWRGRGDGRGRGDWRGRGWQGKRRYDEGGPQYNSDDRRVHYPGQY